ncbi:mitochondrial coenzyme A diphosphatase NUDT8-like isoform X1 [Haliotis rufescens]|uniref:mitochondrial coenzyme A diphosphatase NUDT8-like isoform X1 n=1 Tax=Haliotis rufescens TaxID=6454 RepID=UPI00201F1E8F|nr:mitochondrial coenzyme A diphosphatase NUDT8-like isoform X1 [Haliotis rufescens]XP_048241134.1 mitochondrial coenzyme A diphosphatase NUDT8-like isoform X1 [Haliotis rufescens]XP_048241135.1 mitochondrial coenzyme A diphosphatase NUDT8-like isoform X1 [Haliotis rufescens]
MECLKLQTPWKGLLIKSCIRKQWLIIQRCFHHASPVPHKKQCHLSNHGNRTIATNLSQKGRYVWQASPGQEVGPCILRQENNRRHICRKYFSTTSKKLEVTLDTVFSENNKKRVQDHLLGFRPSSVSRSQTGHSAVLVPLCTVNGEPSFLFTLRSNSLRTHRGQVSFPGGKMDDTDRDVVHTALRETWEELGITMETVDVWGAMMDLPSRENRVTPVIGHCGEVDVEGLTLSEDEVELVFTRTVKSLCDPKNNGQTQFRTSPGYTLPVFLGGEHRIWGLTSMVLFQALTIIAPGLYRHKLRHRS